jgi:hypothetical protein
MMRDDRDDVAQRPTMMMPDNAARGDRLAASAGFAACRAGAGAPGRGSAPLHETKDKLCHWRASRYIILPLR